jgi:hypothetical protein
VTEAEWLTADDPDPMLLYLWDRKVERKSRLLAVACCRLFSHLLVPEALEALAVAERVADGLACEVERRQVRAGAFELGWVADPVTAHRRGPAKSAVCQSLTKHGYDAADAVVRVTSQVAALEPDRPYQDDQPAGLAGYLVTVSTLLRDIFGNPFRPAAFDSAWQTSTVVALAEAIYADRAFDRLPILADALQDAGCEDADVLGHCRGPGPHVRGCWVVDLVLGKH